MLGQGYGNGWAPDRWHSFPEKPSTDPRLDISAVYVGSRHQNVDGGPSPVVQNAGLTYKEPNERAVGNKVFCRAEKFYDQLVFTYYNDLTRRSTTRLTLINSVIAETLLGR